MPVPQASNLVVADSEPSLGSPDGAVAVLEATGDQGAIGVSPQPQQGQKRTFVAVLAEAVSTPLGWVLRRGAAGVDPLPAPQSPNLAAAPSRPGLGASSVTVAAPRATSAHQATEGDPRRLLETDTGRLPLRLEDEQRPKGAGPAEHRSGPIRPEEHIRRRSNQEERAAGHAVVALTAATLVAVGLCRVFARRRPRLGNAGPARRRWMRGRLLGWAVSASQRAGAAAPCRRAGGNPSLLGLRRRRGVRGRAAFRLRVTTGGAARADRARRAAAEAAAC